MRACATVCEQLENRCLLAASPGVTDTLYAASMAAPVLDPTCDTGISHSDRITSNNTPIFQIPAGPTTPQELFAISSSQRGFTQYELDPATGQVLSSFSDGNWAPWAWFGGSALGDGVLYVTGSTTQNGPLHLRAYSLATRQAISDVTLPSSLNSANGLAYLGGKLYLANWGSFAVLDPATGTVLNPFVPVSDGNQYYQVGPSLTGAADLNCLFGVTQDGNLVRIDPATGSVTARFMSFSPGQSVTGMAYANGQLFSLTSQGLVSRVDPATGQVLSQFTLLVGAGMYVAMAGDGLAITNGCHYRVYSDGTQISGNFQQGNIFQSQQLPDGTHSITVTYVDDAGSTIGQSAALTITVDTQPPSVPSAAILDPGSDTGRSNSDGITSDSTPLLQTPPAPQSLFATSSNQDGFAEYELDSNTGQILSTFSDANWAPWVWPSGSALGDGVLYVTGTTSQNGPVHLRTYDLATHRAISDITLPASLPYVGGLAYLNGKLYTANWSSIAVLDPATGAVLNPFIPITKGAQLLTPATNLAGAPDLNALFAVTWEGSLVKIDPDTGNVLAEFVNFDPSQYVTGLAYMNGQLLSMTIAGTVSRVNPATGQVLSQFTLPTPVNGGMYVALAGDGIPTNKTYYRVYADGTQISRDYEQGSTFQCPQLSDGAHSITFAYVDAAGNIGIQSTPLTIRIDTQTPATPSAPTLDPGSDTGISDSDGITADSTPLIQIPSLPQALFATGSGQNGFTEYELDPATGQILGSFSDANWAPWVWNCGCALGDGVLYVTGTTSQNGPVHLRTYDLVTHRAISDLTLANALQYMAGLACLDGKLYASIWGNIVVVDPATGAVLSQFVPVTSSNEPRWIGAALTGAADLNSLFGITTQGSVVRIDPVTGHVSAEFANFDSSMSVTGLGYANGQLFSLTTPGLLSRVDPATGQILSQTNLPMYGQMYVALAGEGAPASSAYYRVYADGVQISGNYEQGNTFQCPQLSDGKHAITIAYVDTAGNITAQSNRLTITVDTQAPAASQSPRLDPASDTGLSNSDGITSDNTPVLNLPAIRQHLFATAFAYNGGLYLDEIDPATGSILNSFTDSSALTSTPFYCGSAMGDGVIYTIVGASSDGLAHLRTYSGTTGALLSDRPLSSQFSTTMGLAYLDGKLYATDGAVLNVLDPATDQYLQTITLIHGQYLGFTGANLTGAADLHTVFAVDWTGALVQIDVGSGVVTVINPSADPTGTVAGLGYANGQIVGLSYDGRLSRFDPTTGQLLGSAALSSNGRFYEALAGDGTQTDGTYYRVYADGVQISGDYEQGSTFQCPQLPDGIHTIAIAYIDAAGNISAQSTPLTITIDTQAPAAPTAPALDAASDTGISSTDALTSDNTPTLHLASTDGYYRLFQDGVQVTGDFAADPTYTTSTLTDGDHQFVLYAVDAAGNISGVSTSLTIHVDTTAPVLQNFVVNDGNAQRSMVDQLTVTFSEPVTLSDGAFRLVQQDGTTPQGQTITVSSPSADGHTFVLTFSGSAIIGQSLADGTYELQISAAAVHDLAGNALTTDLAQTVDRLFGDVDGDGNVGIDDLKQFAQSIGSRESCPDYQWFFDYDANGAILGQDMAAFVKRFVQSLFA